MKLFLSFIFFINLATADEIIWYNDFTSAQKQAITEKKPLLIMFTDPTCHICNSMHKDVFSHKTIITKQSSYFISLILDLQKNKIPTQFKNVAIPSFYFVDTDGNPIAVKIGGTHVYGWNKQLARVITQLNSENNETIKIDTLNKYIKHQH